MGESSRAGRERQKCNWGAVLSESAKKEVASQANRHGTTGLRGDATGLAQCGASISGPGRFGVFLAITL